MKSVFHVHLGSPEQSVWQDGDFAGEEMVDAFAAFQRLISRTDLHGKKVHAKLSFNGQVVCFHRFDTTPPTTICFRGGSGSKENGQGQAMMFFHRTPKG